MTRDEAAAAVRARLDRATRDGDTDAVLSPDALHDAAVLAEFVAPPHWDVGAAYLLGVLHWLRYQWLPEGEDQPDATAALRWFSGVLPWQPDAVPFELHSILAQQAPVAGDDPAAWNDEAARLLHAPVASGNLDILNRVVTLLNDTVRATPPEHPDRATYMSNFGTALRKRFDRTGALVDLDRAVDVSEQAVAATPPDNPDRAGYLSDLGIALRSRFERTGAVADLDRAIDVGEQALAAGASDDPNRAGYLSDLGNALRSRFERTGAVADLDRAIDVGEQALAASASDDPNRAGYLSNLAATRVTRFARAGAVADLDRAIDVGEQAVAATPPNDPYLAAMLSNLGGVLRIRFDRTGAVADLDRAIDVGERAVAAARPDLPDRAAMLANLANALGTRFKRAGVVADLDRAVDVLNRAVAATPPDHPNRAGFMSDLGSVLQLRFERTGALADLDRAVDVGEHAVAAAPLDRPDRALYLSNLGSVLQIRFERTGALADLDRAVDLGEQAVTSTPLDRPDRAGRLSNLAAALQIRFERTGALADLDRAVEVSERAVAATPPDYPDRVRYLSNLAVALRRRFARTALLADLDRAVDVLDQAVAATPADHTDRAAMLNNLTVALRTRFARTGVVADLDRAVDAGERAVAASPPDHPNRDGYLSNFAAALGTRFESTGVIADLDRAVDALNQAVATTPPDHPDRAAMLLNLGLTLRMRFELTGAVADLDQAVVQAGEGLGLESASPALRSRCGVLLAWLAATRSDWVDAGRAWASVLELLPQVLDRSLPRGDRQHLLRTFADVGTGAAAAALNTHGPDRAWELLEQGRGVILGQALDMAIDIDLRREHPDLAADLDQLRTVLNTETLQWTDPTFASIASRRRQAAHEYTALVDTIRTKISFERFGLPPAIGQLQTAAGHDGTLVAINVTPWRCDALILTDHITDHCPLPRLTAADATKQANAFLDALRSPSRASSQTIRDVLTWLWDTVTEPILTHLGHAHHPATAARWPRIWWLPTGPLSVLPLHAATAETGEAVLDRVVSSYLPTVRILNRAQRRPPPSTEPSLIVGVDNAPGYPPLVYAAAEAQAVNTQLGAPTPALINADATLKAVRARLTTTALAHFACHGAPAPDPSDSHLVLHNGPLPVREIANLDLDHAYLAFLSACTTAFGGTTLLDESIHIASAFQLAGFVHVIATLWTINDEYAPALARHVYNNLIPTTDPAHALHHAIRTLRDTDPEHPYLWAPTIHFGP